MLTYSFNVPRSPSVWLLGLMLAACSSALDAPSESTTDRGAVGDIGTAGGGGGVLNSGADDPAAAVGAAAGATAPQPPAASSELPEADVRPDQLGTNCDDGEVRCGNGRIDADEDCEIGLPGWTSSNCSASCRQTLYPNANPCTFEISVDPIAFYAQGNCPDLPGFTERCFYLVGQSCQLLCNDTEDCPIGFKCNPKSNPTLLGPGWCAKP
jgi:hypothetical protein